ncbi:sensor histidine kinase [Mycetocola spongiae]|uniref:sensor histidine kinase n=1 Tax=Mycetocola spongiae TaxID=2859226 RepID=UPI001CF4EAE9|nr:HAMP domain-containing sensor histidine kinase [Mycetocola spongiae]
MHDSISEWWNTVSLRSKITGVTVLVLAFGILVAGIGTMAMLKPAVQGQLDAKLKATAESYLNNNKVIRPTASSGVAGSGSGNDYYTAVFEPTRGVFLTSNWMEKPAGQRPQIPATLVISDAVGSAGIPFSVDSVDGNTHFRAVLLRATISNYDEPGVLMVAVSTAETEKFIAMYLTIFFGLGLGVILFGAALTRLLVTSTFTPLREVEHMAAAIAEGDFSQRLAVSTPNTEVGRLNRSLNTMLNRIDRAFSDRAKTIGQMRRFVGDASHELRTPLVTVRGYAELYRMGALQTDEDVAQAMERIEKEAIRMGTLVEDLLELARLDETKPLNLAVIDLAAIARDSVMDARAASPGRTVNVVIDHPEPVAPAVPAAPEAADTGEATAIPPRPPLPPNHDALGGHPPLTRPPATDEIPGVGVEPAAAKPGARGAGRGRGARDQAGAEATPSGAIALVSRLRGRRPRRASERGAAAELPPTPIASTTPRVPTLEVPAMVLAEENKIRQVVTNLIGNALRFTPVECPIEIGVSANPETGEATIAVIDHGEGVPEQIREKIFQRFWRADTSRARETGGSGLGLAIVSSIITAHRGSVTVGETPGGGATFRVRLPLIAATPEAPEADAEPGA